MENWKQPANLGSVWQNKAPSALVETMESSRIRARIRGGSGEKEKKVVLKGGNSLLEEEERPLPFKPWGHRSNIVLGSVLIGMTVC